MTAQKPDRKGILDALQMTFDFSESAYRSLEYLIKKVEAAAYERGFIHGLNHKAEIDAKIIDLHLQRHSEYNQPFDAKCFSEVQRTIYPPQPC